MTYRQIFDTIIKLNEKIDFIPSIGIARYEIEGEGLDSYYLYTFQEDGIGIRGGLAMQVNFNENIGLRVGGRYVHLEDFDSVDNIMEITTGLRFTF